MRRARTATQMLFAIVASLALAACRGEARARPRSDAPASSAHDAIASGPCGGRSVGAFACEGATVVRCADISGATTAVRTCTDLERCDAERGRCDPACPDGEVLVPETGPDGFVMGKGQSPYAFGTMASHNIGRGVADAPHRVVLTHPFCMDATEVTAAAYARCVEEGACSLPKIGDRWCTYASRPDHPINMVDWTQAKAYCEHIGKSLPTEAQWEWAATGGDGRAWPWGDDEPTCDHADFTPGVLVSPGGDSGCRGGGTSPVASHEAGDKVWASGAIHDLAGNVWEWCLDTYVAYPTNEETDPLHVEGLVGTRVIRGGGWNRSARGLRAAFRGAAVVTYQVPGLGFRCVRNAVTAPVR